MGRKKNSKDGLPPEDARLWNLYARDIAPLNPDIVLSEEAPRPLPTPRKRAVAAPALPPPGPLPSAPPQLDGATARKLRRGQIAIDARIDLHGMTQATAQAALTRFVLDAAGCGHRCVLVITGKGKGLGEERGILRRRLADWLSAPPLAALVLRRQEAAPKDGGAGAFYLYLKRKR